MKRNRIGEELPKGGEPPELTWLFEHGRRKGVLKRSDILDIVPDAEFDDDLFNNILQRLASQEISFDEDGQEAEPAEQVAIEEQDDQEVVEEARAIAGDAGIDVLEGVETDDMVRLYVREAAQTPLLTADEEVELARRIERCRLAQEELSAGNLPPQREAELQRLIRDGQAAREHMIRANARLVISVANKYTGRGMPFLDLIQEGNIGLMRAIRNFDYQRGFKFSTYATWWIRQGITRSLAEQGRTIRLPVHMSDDVNRMLRVQSELSVKLGRMPTQEELSNALEVPLAKVNQMLQIVRQPLSLQAPVGDQDEEELGNLIEDPATLDPEEAAIQTTMSEDLHKRLEVLRPRELEVVKLRYGLGEDPPMNLSEVGRRLGITRERARQLEAQALKRLRNPTARKKRRSRNL